MGSFQNRPLRSVKKSNAKALSPYPKRRQRWQRKLWQHCQTSMKPTTQTDQNELTLMKIQLSKFDRQFLHHEFVMNLLFNLIASDSKEA